MLTIWVDTTDRTYNEVIVKNLKQIGSGIKFRKVTYVEGNVIKPAKGEVILACGPAPLKELQSRGYVPKNKGVMKLRGHPIKKGKGHYLFTFSPGIVHFDIAKDPEIRWDLRLAERFSRTGSTKPEVGKYRWVKHFDKIIAEVKRKYKKTGKPVDVATDLETMGLNPFDATKEIVSISFTVKEGYSDLYYCLGRTEKQKRRILKQIKWLLTTDKISMKGANLKYDNVWMMEKWKLRCTNFKMDTLLTGSLLNENRSNSLTNHSREYTALGGYDSEMNENWDKGHMEFIPKKILRTYAGGDTDATLRVSKYFRNELKEERGLQNLYVNIIHPAAKVLEEVEHRGLCVDLGEYKKLRKVVKDEIKGLRKEIISMMPRKLKDEYRDRDDLLVPTVLKDFLFTKKGLGLKPKMRTEKTNEPSMTMDHIIMFENDPAAKKFFDAFKQLKGAEKTLQTYIDGFLNHLRSDGKFHPTYLLYNGSAFGSDDDDGGTVTGRSSAKDPAVQTIPKHTKYAKALRKCYPAPPGWKYWSIDFDQGELKIAACLAHERTMLKLYKAGGDIHCNTGASFGGFTLEQFMKLKEEDKDTFGFFRGRAKPANFGLLYGMQAPGYREFARTAYQVILTPEEAEDQRNLFFGTYTGLLPWHENYVQMAHRDLQVTSPLGRIRHLPLINSRDWKVKSQGERQAINSPVQSCLSDLCYWSMVKIREEFTMDEVWIAGNTHDNLYGYVPEKYAIKRIRKMKEIMENLPIRETFHWDHQLPFTVSCEIGMNMAETEELKF